MPNGCCNRALLTWRDLLQWQFQLYQFIQLTGIKKRELAQFRWQHAHKLRRSRSQRNVWHFAKSAEE